MEWEEVYEKYKLSEEEQNAIGNYINQIFLEGKTPMKNPIAIFDIGPTGSGKTALNGYALTQFENNNLVIVNNDELKPFHPKADEIAKQYPEVYIKVVNEASKHWTDDLMDKALEGNFNVLYEGTGRKIKIFEKMIEKMRQQGYRIIVRAMAVNELNCLMSMVERYEGQVQEKGWGRSVSAETFYKGYDNEMLDTIDIFEKTGMADIVEVYMRGTIPTEPKRIYSSRNREFKDARTAIIVGRERDKKSAEQYYEQKFTKRGVKPTKYPEESELLKKIAEIYDKEQGIQI